MSVDIFALAFQERAYSKHRNGEAKAKKGVVCLLTPPDGLNLKIMYYDK